jgi:hypothetical protein
VGVEPVEVFKEGRAAALGGVQEAAVEEALDGEEDHGDGDDGCPEDRDDGRGVVGPDEEGGQAEPCESWARVREMVTLKLRPQRMEEMPATKAASPAEMTLVSANCVLSGVVKVQPVSTPPPMT